MVTCRSAVDVCDLAETTDKPYAEAIKELLAERGHSLRWLADQVGVNIAHLVRVGQGKKQPSRRLILNTTVALKLPMDYFREVRKDRLLEFLEDDPEMMDQMYVQAQRRRRKPAPKRTKKP
jgi:hypothetical protein